jgi:hypothetical protein
MTVKPAPGRAPISTDPPDGHSKPAWWAVGLAAAVAVVIAVSYAIFAVAWAVGGSDAVSDNWVGLLAAFALLGGLAASLAAFLLAVAAKVKHERWAILWLPLSLFPALLVVVVLVETLWME